MFFDSDKRRLHFSEPLELDRLCQHVLTFSLEMQISKEAGPDLRHSFIMYIIFRDEILRCVSDKHNGMYPLGLAAGGFYFSLMICEKNEQIG